MNYTTNSSRVPNNPGSNSSDSGDVGPAPANSSQFPDSVSFNGTYDGATPNPPGRVASDIKGMRSQFVTCRKHALISTFNTRTLFPSGTQFPSSLPVLSAKQQKIDIIAIQEHRLYYPNIDIQYNKIEDYQLVTAS